MRQLLCLVMVMTGLSSSAQLDLPAIFADQMVLQREQPVRIWGEAAPQTVVDIEIDAFTVRTKTDASGQWEALYPAHDAGGPYTMSVTTDDQSISFSDCWFGDVWVAGGQSNMEWKLSREVNNWQEEVADSDFPQIRFFEVPKITALTPQEDIPSGAWKVASPETSGDFSAVAWFFAKRNHLEKNVPVGIIDDNWGGTPAESWTSAQALREVPGYQKQADEMLDPAADWAARKQASERNDSIKWKLINDKKSFLEKGIHLPEFDDSDWETVVLPNTTPLTDFAWVRKSFELDQLKNPRLYLGEINQICHVFLNGQLIAEESWQDTTGVWNLSADDLRKGTNVIAIRAINSWNNQVYIGRKNEMWLKTDEENVSLAGEWRYSNEMEPKMPVVERISNWPAVLYNGMIRPIAGFTMKGVIWYQGEGNAGKPHLYRDLFATMIQDWRIQWRQGDFPFLFVQLANYMKRQDEPGESNWAALREAQTQTLALPNTGMATIIDVGDANDIHPRNKQDVGYRLWLQARKVAFGEELVASGPTYSGHETKEGKIIVSFDQVGDGLKVKGNRLKGFAIAGEDQNFVWAQAELRDDQVVLSHPEIESPKHVRYAWADNPGCNLYNEKDLPAVPFRTDQ